MKYGGGVRKRKDKKIMRPHISSQSPEFARWPGWPTLLTWENPPENI